VADPFIAPRSRLKLPDLVSEVTISLTTRPGRTLLTALGTVLGVAALVATLGLAGTAGNQIVSRFNELEATQVTITPTDRSFGRDQNQISVIPFNSDGRLARLNGVVAAGTISDVDLGGAAASSVPVTDPLGLTEFQIPALAVSPGLFDAARATVLTGRVFDEGHNQRQDPVVVLGPAAAQRLNVTNTATAPAIFIGEQPMTVIGILADVRRKPELLNAIIMPNGFARDRFGLQAPAEVLVETEIGAAELIGVQAPTALFPNNPDLLRSQVPPSPSRTRSAVEDDITGLFLVLGGISLIVGAIGIANVTLVSVLERTGEIGLRRALGGTRRHVAVQFLAESGALGFLAGLLGTSLGVLTVVAVSASREWTPVLNPLLPLAAPFVGTLIGLIAGTYPAWKASRLEPITALRGAA
jgi:ABC-type antimicrobial peptide transport system permease subunit